MAINSKTVIGGDSKQQSELMLRAGAQGQESVDRARGELNTQQRFGAQQVQQNSQAVGGLVQNAEQMNQQQEQFDAKMSQDRQQFDRKMASEETQTNLEGAKSGFEQESESDRQRSTREEMERGYRQSQMGGASGPIPSLDSEGQQNLQEQGGKGLENQGGRWRATEERKTAEARKSYEAATERMRAETYKDQVGLQYQKAQIAGDKEAMKEHAQTLAKPINGDTEKFDRLMNGKGNDGDWTSIKEAAQTDEGMEPILQKDIESKQMTPRVQAFVRDHIAKEGIKFIVRTGNTGDLKVDWTHPKMREFTEQVQTQSLLAKQMGPEFARFAGINSVESKMTYLNKLAAMQVFLGQGTPSASPTQGMQPSSGGPQPQQQGQPFQGEQQSGVGQAMRQGLPQQKQQPAQQPQRPRMDRFQDARQHGG